MKFNKNMHLIIWILYGFSLVLYDGFGVEYALFAAYVFMAGIILQIIKWALCIPEVKKNDYKNKTTV